MVAANATVTTTIQLMPIEAVREAGPEFPGATRVDGELVSRVSRGPDVEPRHGDRDRRTKGA